MPLLQNVLQELHQHAETFFEQERILQCEQMSLYHGLYWDTYRYNVVFPENETVIYIKIPLQIDDHPLFKTQQELQEHIQASYTHLQHLYTAFHPYPGYSVIKPIACFPEWFALITQESPGTDVWTIIREKARFFPAEAELNELRDICQKCGKWLAVFQHITKDSSPGQFDGQQMMALFDELLGKLVRHPNADFSDEFKHNVLQACQRFIDDMPEKDREISGLHGDFAPVNILIHDGHITVLDIETPQYGLIYWDAAYFHYQVNSLTDVPIYRPAAIRTMQESFLAGLGKPLDFSQHAVLICLVHNIIQSLLYFAEHRRHVAWYKKIYDTIRYKKHVQWLRHVCEL